MKFVPERLSIAAGDEVEWKNEDIVPHTTAAPGVFSSPVMAPGEVFRATIGSAGAVPYGCTLHPTMRASLTVTP